jgi:hypothetical protein
MPIDLTSPRVLLELNGADPFHVVGNMDIRVDVLDWDEVRDGVTTNEELIAIHDEWEERAPGTAQDIRAILRERGLTVPAEYNSDFTTTLSNRS